jgi:hypothetical protein
MLASIPLAIPVTRHFFAAVLYPYILEGLSKKMGVAMRFDSPSMFAIGDCELDRMREIARIIKSSPLIYVQGKDSGSDL